MVLSARYGIAVDLGTTSVSLALARLSAGAPPRVVASAEARNAQAPEYGRDILSRLSAALGGQELRLRDLAQLQVIELLKQACVRAQLGLSEVVAATERVVVAGNSVMAALFVGADVSSLASAPFVAVRDLRCATGPLAQRMGDDPARVTVLEPLDAFVGGDARAGLIAVGLGTDRGTDADADADAESSSSHNNCADIPPGARKSTLFIDLGTNTEVVLARGSQLFVCSAPAGPAFEGGGFKVVGSEVLADVADLLRQGVLGVDGKLDERDRRVRRDEGGIAFVRGARCRHAISQRYLRDLQLAKAATATALSQVLEAAGTVVAELSRINIAGTFGSALVPDDLVTLGLIPDMWRDRIRFQGNASLSGALAVLGGASTDIESRVTLRSVTLPNSPAFNAALIAATDFRWTG